MDARAQGFAPYDYTAEIDFQAHVKATPADATYKGMFFSECVRALREAAPNQIASVPAAQRRYFAFSDYPNRDFWALLGETAPIAFPDLPASEAVRRIGWNAFPRFVESMIGRIVVGVFLDDIDRLLSAMAKAWPHTASIGEVKWTKLGPTEGLCEIREHPGVIVPYLTGSTEGIFGHYKIKPTILVRTLSRGSFEMHIEWTNE